MSISLSLAVSMITGTLLRARSWRQTSVPDRPGSIRSRSTRSAPLRSNSSSAVGAVVGDRHLVALLAQQVRQRVAERLLVLDHEDPGHAVLSFWVVGSRSWRRPERGAGRSAGRRASALGGVGQPHGERGALALDAPDGHLAAVVGGDVLDDGQAEAGAAGGPRAGRVDPVEALEDPLLLRRRRCRRPGRVTATSTSPPVRRTVDGDPGVVRRVGDRVVDEVADRGHQQVGVAVDLGARGRRRRRARCRLRRRGQPAPVDGLGDDVVDGRPARGCVQGVGDLQPRQVDDLLHQRVSRPASTLHPGGEPAYRLGVVARRPATASASRRSAADRRLELVADVGDEVAADLLDPAGLGAVLDEHAGRGRCRAARPGRARRGVARPSGPRASSSSLLADHAVPAHRPGDQVAQLGWASSCPRTSPNAYAAGLALTTPSPASRTTAAERSTARTPTDTGRASSGSGCSQRRPAARARSAPERAARRRAPTTRPTRRRQRRRPATGSRRQGKVRTDPGPSCRTARGRASRDVHLGCRRVHGALATVRASSPADRAARTHEQRGPGACASSSTRSSTPSPTSWSR